MQLEQRDQRAREVTGKVDMGKAWVAERDGNNHGHDGSYGKLPNWATQ